MEKYGLLGFFLLQLRVVLPSDAKGWRERGAGEARHGDEERGPLGTLLGAEEQFCLWYSEVASLE